MGVSSLGKDHTWEINLAARAAWMSYIGDMTQSEIARRLNVSNARVHKLIQLARRQGIVRVSIEGRPAECLDLEAKIAKSFGLMNCTISPYLAKEDESPAMVRASIGQAAGQILAQHLNAGDIRNLTIGVGGETLKAAINAMPEITRRDLVVRAGQGTLDPTLAAGSKDILTLLEQRTNASIQQLPVPTALPDPAQRDLLLGYAPVAQVLEDAATADLFVAQIQPLGPSVQDLPDNIVKNLIRDGTVLRIFGGAVSKTGAIVDSEAANALTGVGLDAIASRVSNTEARCVVIAPENAKPDHIKATLASGIASDLILSERQAIELVEAID